MKISEDILKNKEKYEKDIQLQIKIKKQEEDLKI